MRPRRAARTPPSVRLPTRSPYGAPRRALSLDLASSPFGRAAARCCSRAAVAAQVMLVTKETEQQRLVKQMHAQAPQVPHGRAGAAASRARARLAARVCSRPRRVRRHATPRGAHAVAPRERERARARLVAGGWQVLIEFIPTEWVDGMYVAVSKEELRIQAELLLYMERIERQVIEQIEQERSGRGGAASTLLSDVGSMSISDDLGITLTTTDFNTGESHTLELPSVDAARMVAREQARAMARASTERALLEQAEAGASSNSKLGSNLQLQARQGIEQIEQIEQKLGDDQDHDGPPAKQS
eukprot:4233498-Prymnesium_polylepis.1